MDGVDRQDVEAVVVGDIMMDRQYWVHRMPPAGGDTFILHSAQNSGGSAANTATALRALGVSCSFCGCVGDDPDGRELSDRLDRQGVDVSCMMEARQTGYTLTIIEDSGERTMFSKRCDEPDAWRITPGLEGQIGRARLLLLSGYLLSTPKQAEFCVEAAALARRVDTAVALDASPVIGQVDEAVREEILCRTQILLPNRQELLELTGEEDAERGLLEILRRVPCVGLKLGAAGAMLAAEAGFAPPGGNPLKSRTVCREAARAVQAVDTTGAGDAFNAGFLASCLAGEPPRQWLKSGNALAARVISQQGAVTSFQ